jgi:hypothetical protein
MKEVLAFLWLIRFTGMDLGGRNGGTGFHVNDCLPFSGSDSESEPTSDSEDFTSATNDFFEWTINSVMPGALMEVTPLPVSFFIFPLSFFSCGLDWLS